MAITKLPPAPTMSDIIRGQKIMIEWARWFEQLARKTGFGDASGAENVQNNLNTAILAIETEIDALNASLLSAINNAQLANEYVPRMPLTTSEEIILVNQVNHVNNEHISYGNVVNADEHNIYVNNTYNNADVDYFATNQIIKDSLLVSLDTISTETATRDLTLVDDYLIIDTSGGSFTLNLPSVSFCQGKVYRFVGYNLLSIINSAVIQTAGSEQIRRYSTDTSTSITLSSSSTITTYTIASTGTYWQIF